MFKKKKMKMLRQVGSVGSSTKIRYNWDISVVAGTKHRFYLVISLFMALVEFHT